MQRNKIILYPLIMEKLQNSNLESWKREKEVQSVKFDFWEKDGLNNLTTGLFQNKVINSGRNSNGKQKKIKIKTYLVSWKKAARKLHQPQGLFKSDIILDISALLSGMFCKLLLLVENHFQLRIKMNQNYVK